MIRDTPLTTLIATGGPKKSFTSHKNVTLRDFAKSWQRTGIFQDRNSKNHCDNTVSKIGGNLIKRSTLSIPVTNNFCYLKI